MEESYYLKNKHKLIKKNRAYHKERLAVDIDYKLRYYVRNRIYHVLKLRGIRLKNPFELVGCSITALKVHLENKFTIGMNWENYGKWHVDHIRPCANYDLTNTEQQRECFNYMNLQPLWAEDNIKKGGYYTEET